MDHRYPSEAFHFSLVHQCNVSCTNTYFSQHWYTKTASPVQTHISQLLGTEKPPIQHQSHAKSLAPDQASGNYDKTCGIFLNNNRMTKRKNSRKTERVTVMVYMERQITVMKAMRRLGTARNYTRARNSLHSFLEGHDVSFRRMDENLILGYNNWLERRGVVKNTISFYMRILRSIYNKAVKDSLTKQKFPFRNVYTGIDKTRKRALDEKVIKKIMELDLKDSPSLTLSRDIFMFSYCMRGMSFVDIAFLRKQSFDGDYISYRRQKTGQRLTVLVEPCIARIIQRYAKLSEGTPYIFPIISSDNPEEAYRQYQTALGYHNRKLKELAKRANVNLPLSSYWARHTWATVARNHNIPVSVIGAAMGHSSERTTLIYLASLENSVIDKANRLVIGSISKMVSP